MKCRVCRAAAAIDVRRHNAAFCKDHFLAHCRQQTRRAIEKFDMFGPEDDVVVAVSGGKDSLALWHLLGALGHEADGLYIGLGIDEYSEESAALVRAFATGRGLKLHEVDLAAEWGFDVPTAARTTRRAPCGSCGLSKRHLFNRVAL
ncbi:MAG: tRNA(Ile)-lysidine synthetase, partial [Actinobacteria bacterium ATB1]|nr:tRNA(Ile)-lysidine synthetase [Actinobacteria bacterium ATB1]